jgi:hypothetical protein
MLKAISLIAAAKKLSAVSALGVAAAATTLAGASFAGATTAPHASKVKMALSRSVAPSPKFQVAGVCGVTGANNSLTCDSTIVKAIDAARKIEPIPGLPPKFNVVAFSKLSYAEQLFAIADIERTERGLAPFAGLTVQLNAIAAQGASFAADPAAPLPMRLTGGGTATMYGSNWSEGTANALGADYYWMYDDGTNSPNADCRVAGQSGCWGHRANILGAYRNPAYCPAGMSINMVMGAAEITSHVAATPSIGEIFVNDCGKLPTMYFTWADVEKLVFGI